MEIPVRYTKITENPEWNTTKPLGSVPKIIVSHYDGIMIGLSKTEGADKMYLVPAAVILTKDNNFEVIELTRVTKREEE